MKTNLSHVIAAVYNRPWYIHPDQLAVIDGIVRLHADGGRLSPAEIQARLDTAAASAGPRRGARTMGSIAVIPIYGVIMPRANLMTDFSGGATVSGIRQNFRDALEDETVGSILLDIDSPGGYTDGIEELAAEIREARGQKPILSIADYTMASAAYYLGSQADEVSASPSGMVGWIGTVMVHQEFSKMDEQDGVTTTIIRNPPGKFGGNQYEPLSDQARTELQAQVDEHSAQFHAAVAKGRGVSVATVKSSFGAGGGMTSAKAKDAGLVDRVETLDQAIRRLATGKGPAPRSAQAMSYVPVDVPARKETAGDIDEPELESPDTDPPAPQGGDDLPADDPEATATGEAGTPPSTDEGALEDLELRKYKNRARGR